MPIYEYDCPHCGRFETIQKIDEKPLKDCPTCKEAGRKSKVQRVVSTAAFHLKGSGWYKTDYSKSGSANTAASNSSSSDTPAKTEKSAEKSDKGGSGSKAGAKGCGPGCGCH